MKHLLALMRQVLALASYSNPLRNRSSMNSSLQARRPHPTLCLAQKPLLFSPASKRRRHCGSENEKTGKLDFAPKRGGNKYFHCFSLSSEIEVALAGVYPLHLLVQRPLGPLGYGLPLPSDDRLAQLLGVL
jgi:hypothetical protein